VPSAFRAVSLSFAKLSATTRPHGSSSLSSSMRAHAGTIAMNGALTLICRQGRALPPTALACAVVRSAGMTHKIHCADCTAQSLQDAPIEWQRRHCMCEEGGICSMGRVRQGGTGSRDPRILVFSFRLGKLALLYACRSAALPAAEMEVRPDARGARRPNRDRPGS
jgi:hypothetical protein